MPVPAGAGAPTNIRTVRLADDTTSAGMYLRPAFPSAVDPVWLTKFNPGSPTVREVKEDAPGRNGTTDTSMYVGARTITASMLVRGDPGAGNAWTYVDEILSFCDPASRPYLYEQRPGWPDERRYRLRFGQYNIDMDSSAAIRVPLDVTWVGTDGFWEAADEYTSVPVAPFVVQSGTGLPLVFTATGWSFPAGVSNSPTILTNSGGLSTPPVLRIYGPCTNPAVTVRGTSKAFALTYAMPAGHYVDVDMGNQTVYQDSDPSQSLYSTVNWAVSSWWELAKGDNGFVLSASNPGASCVLYVIYRPRGV